MKKLISLVIMLAMITALVGCGGNSDGNSNGDKGGATGAYDSATAVLTAAWDNVDEAQKFPVIGGTADNMVDGAPGAIDVADKDMMTYSLYIPEDVQGAITEAADMMHMMNANTFTAVAVKLDGMASADAMAKLEESLSNAQYMCGAPEKFLFADVDGYVIYALGEAMAIDDFKAAVEKLTNVNSEVKLVDFEIAF